MIWFILGTILAGLFTLKSKRPGETLAIGIFFATAGGFALNVAIGAANPIQDLKTYRITSEMSRQELNNEENVVFTTEQGQKWSIPADGLTTRVGSANVLEVRTSRQLNHWISIVPTSKVTEYTIVIPGPGL